MHVLSRSAKTGNFNLQFNVLFFGPHGMQATLAWNSVSQPFLPFGTLGQLFQYFAAPLDAKIGLKAIKSDN